MDGQQHIAVQGALEVAREAVQDGSTVGGVAREGDGGVTGIVDGRIGVGVREGEEGLGGSQQVVPGHRCVF